jgi:hypothetical protein
MRRPPAPLQKTHDGYRCHVEARASQQKTERERAASGKEMRAEDAGLEEKRAQRPWEGEDELEAECRRKKPR